MPCIVNCLANRSTGSATLRPLLSGVETFRTYVQGWYEGSFQDVVFYEHPKPGCAP